MAAISIDLGTAAQTARVVDAMCSVYGYTGDGTTASRNAFAKAQLVKYLKDVVKGFEANAAAEAARVAKVADVDANVNPS